MSSTPALGLKSSFVPTRALPGEVSSAPPTALVPHAGAVDAAPLRAVIFAVASDKVHAAVGRVSTKQAAPTEPAGGEEVDLSALKGGAIFPDGDEGASWLLERLRRLRNVAGTEGVTKIEVEAQRILGDKSGGGSAVGA